MNLETMRAVAYADLCKAIDQAIKAMIPAESIIKLTTSRAKEAELQLRGLLRK